MTEIELIKWYIEERIKIDAMPEGFSKSYAEGRIKQQNTKVLTAACRMEVDLSNPINNKLNKAPVMPSVCNNPRGECSYRDANPDSCNTCHIASNTEA